MTMSKPATRILGIRRVVVRAGARWDTVPVNAACCCQRVGGFRYADDMCQLVGSRQSMRVLIVEDEPFMAEAIRDGLRLEAIAADIAGDGNIRAGAAERERLRHRRPRPRHPRALRRRDRRTHRRLRQRHAHPHAYRCRPARRQDHRLRARRRRLPHQAVRTARARAPPPSARPPARPQPAACPRDRGSAAGSVPPRGLPRRSLRRADQEAIRGARSSRRCRRRRRQRRGPTGAGLG